MAAWLHNERKVDLIALADEAGLKGVQSMRKDDLVSMLDDHLQTNASKLYRNASFAGYFKSAGSPVKREHTASTNDSDAASVRPRRRTTKARADIDGTTVEEHLSQAVSKTIAATKTIAARTPHSIRQAAAQIPLPVSPAEVTELVERQTQEISSRVSSYWDDLGLVPYLETIRGKVSTAAGIQGTCLLLEAFFLQLTTLSWQHAFNIPLPGQTRLFGLPFLEQENHIEVKYPDLFVLLTGEFWAASTSWVMTSILLPLAVAWIFNLTITAKRSAARQEVDPLAFNVSKGLISWLVFSQGVRFAGILSDRTVARVDGAVPHVGVMIGAGLGILFSLYEAVLRR